MKCFKLMGALLVLALAFFAGACKTHAVLTDDMPANKIIQRAQEASDTNKYQAALEYYQALKERYGDSGEYLCTAEYEIAFIHYKQKKYAESKREFENLLARYDDVDAELLPAHFKVLSEKVLSKIEEKTVNPKQKKKQNNEEERN